MSDTGNPPAGWYPDPTGQGRRYWDGTRWTEEVVPDTAPPPPASPAPPAPAAPLEPVGPAAVPAAPVPAPGALPPVPAPGTYPPAPAAGTTSGAQPTPQVPGAAAGRSGAAVLKGLDGLLLVMVAAGLFFLATFLDWYGATSTNPQTGEKVSDAVNGWDGDAFWMLLGPGAGEAVEKAAARENPSGRSDMFLVFPLVAGAAVLAFMVRTGKGKPRFVEATIGLGALAAVLVLLEAQSFSSRSGDAGSQLAQYGIGFDGGARIGLWLGFLCCCGVVGGAVKHRIDSAKAPTAQG